MRRIFVSTIVLLLVTTVISQVIAQPQVDKKASAKAFVQKFYDWYVPLYNKTGNSIKSKTCSCDDITALKQKAADFDPGLRKAIIEDANAQAKANEIVGLDSDPFLMAQDTGFGYQAGNVWQNGQKIYVDIHSDNISKSKKQILMSPVTVIAEVTEQNGHWIFTNFIYPSDGRKDDLVSILKKLKADRNTPVKQ